MPAPNPPSLEADQLHVWETDLGAARIFMTQLENALAADERSRVERFKFDHHRHLFITARGILRDVLSRYAGRSPCDLTFAYGPYGKPELAGIPLCFNISHTDDKLLIAVTRHAAVGIDVESARSLERMEELPMNLFPEADRREILSLPPPRRQDGFLAAWTRKEAYLKAMGIGFAEGVGPPPPPGCRFLDVPLAAGHRGTVAVLGPVKEIRHLIWTGPDQTQLEKRNVTWYI